MPPAPTRCIPKSACIRSVPIPPTLSTPCPRICTRWGPAVSSGLLGLSKNYRHDLPNVTGLQVYNDTATGVPLAIMDCSYLTGLQRPPPSARLWPSGVRASSARTLALVGCGFEGTDASAIPHQQRFPRCRVVRLRDVRE